MKNLDSTKLFLEDRYGKKYTNEKLKSMDFVETHAVYEAVDCDDFETLDRLFEIGAGDNPYNSTTPGTGTSGSAAKKMGAGEPIKAKDNPDVAEPQKPAKAGQSNVDKLDGEPVDSQDVSKGDLVTVKTRDGKVVDGKVLSYDNLRGLVLTDKNGSSHIVGYNTLQHPKTEVKKKNALATKSSTVGQRLGNLVAPPPTESVELARIKELAGIEETTCAGAVASAPVSVTSEPIKRMKKRKKRDSSE